MLLKRGALLVALILVSPLILLARAGGVLGGSGLFVSCGCLLSLLPGKTGSYARVAYYLGTLSKIHPDVSIGFGTFLSKRTAWIGRDVSLGAYCLFGDVVLRDGASVASGVSVISGKHQHGSSTAARGPAGTQGAPGYQRVTVGRRTWIGERAVVMADVGDDCIVAAGSVVTRAVPSGFVVAGNPARPVGRTREEATNGE